MSINWLEVIASIVNFLVLIFLLRRFLYGPIVRVMDEREQKITGREDEAAEKARRAEEEAAAFRKRAASLEARREELLDEARRAAAAERSSLAAAARLDVDERRRRWYEALARERESFGRELRRQLSEQACLIARRCLQDLAGARLEEAAWNHFMEKLESLPGEELTGLKEALLASGTVKVSSAFEVSPEGLERLKVRLSELTSSAGPAIDHRQDRELVCGLELEAGGHRLAWSVESYLQNVEQQILKSLEEADRRGEGAAHAS